MSCSSSDEDDNKPPTAFAKQLYTLLDNDRQPVDRDSKYTAFWLAHGMTLSSQYRIGQHGDWQLNFEDPSTDHPKGKFICGACEEAAERDWDPCEEYRRRRDAEAERREAEEFRNENRDEEDTEEGGSEEDDEDDGGDDDEEEQEEEKLEDWEGVADVHQLRQHAATRQHILNMQFLRRACINCKMNTTRIALKYISQAFDNCLKSSLWRGSELGVDQVADLLQSFQVGNAGVAQIIGRCEAKAKRRGENGYEPYDSDDSYPDIAEHEEWYPFQRAARKVPQPKCGVCWGHHPLNLCCCGKDTTERKSAFAPDTKLGTCAEKICRAAAQKTRQLKWMYSFEAECLLFALHQPHTADRTLCKGIAGDHVPALQPGKPSEHVPADALEVLNKMGDSIKTRPAFADMFVKARDKLAFVQRVRPYIYVGVTGGVTSSFCTGVPAESSDMSPAARSCRKLITVERYQ